MPLQTGQVLNKRYRIVKLLGQGGFGAVYRAWDINFQLPCALKENTETSDEGRRQFLREAQILHTLRHTNLPLVKDYFIIPGQGQYLVMDFVEGEDLQAILERQAGALPEEQVLPWLVEICEALAYLHTVDPPVIHRDIKPANIKISTQGRAMLVDFGISKIFTPDVVTTRGARAVTPGYSPFEQYGHAPTDARTDIYALGATAYTLLTGKVPPESIARMAGTELKRPRQLNPAISPGTESAILRAIELMPDQRFASATEFRASLAAPPAAPVQATTQPPRVAATAAVSQVGAFIPPTAVAAPIEVSSEPTAAKPQTLVKLKPASPAVPAKRARRWPKALLLGGLGLALLAALAFAFWPNLSTYLFPAEPAFEKPIIEAPIEEPIEKPMEEPIERPMEEPDFMVALDGIWSGVREEFGGERLVVDFQLVIEHAPGTDHFGGHSKTFFPDGHIEAHPFEGGIEIGPEVIILRIVDEIGLHYWGEYLQDERILGVYSDCFDCDPWGRFEVHRE